MPGTDATSCDALSASFVILDESADPVARIERIFVPDYGSREGYRNGGVCKCDRKLRDHGTTNVVSRIAVGKASHRVVDEFTCDVDIHEVLPAISFGHPQL